MARCVSFRMLKWKSLEKSFQIVDQNGQTYIIQGGNQDIMDALQGT